MSTEQEHRIDVLARQLYGRGRLRRDAVGEWYWARETGEPVYLGWTLAAAEHQIRVALYGNNRRPFWGHGSPKGGRTNSRF